MTEEELKNIQAPQEGQKAPLTETQKRRNAFWIQMLGALVLLVVGFVLVIALEIGAAFFLARVIKTDASIMRVYNIKNMSFPINFSGSISCIFLFLKRLTCS